MTASFLHSQYIFGSRILTHVLFWMLYYLCFSLLWAKDGLYHQSFGLEFVLMPIRITASYLTIYWLIPKLLLKRQELKFVMAVFSLLILSGVLQRVFTFFFYDMFFAPESTTIWDIRMIVRSMVLINSTVLLLSAVKMYDYWRIADESNGQEMEEYLVIRSDKRNFRVRPSEILYMEGLGNYATFYLSNRKPLISYMTLKELEQLLPENFKRVHKSFIVNKDHVESFTNENVEIGDRIIPVGKSVQIDF